MFTVGPMINKLIVAQLNNIVNVVMSNPGNPRKFISQLSNHQGVTEAWRWYPLFRNLPEK